MTKLLLAILLLLLGGACDAQPRGDGATPAPQLTREKAAPIISMRGSEIKINGVTVWLGDTLDSWKRVLGGTPTCYDAGLIASCVWHSNGLTLGTGQTDKTRVKFMNGERQLSWPVDDNYLGRFAT